MRRFASVLGTLLLFVACGVAHADSITMRGSSIPLGGCEIQAITDGRIYYADPRGRRQWRELREIDAISFDGLPRLDEAERALDRGENDAGLRLLLRTLLEAEDEQHRIWLRVRIIREHDARGEYVQAASHLASLYMLREESTWRELEPLGEANRPPLPALAEAMHRLTRARRSVRNPTLRASIDRMIATIKPIHDEAAAAHDGDAIDPARTISGYPIADIRAGRAPRTADEGGSDAAEQAGSSDTSGDDPKTETGPARDEPPTPDAGDRRIGRDRDSPDGIDVLLRSERSADALALCRRIARDPDERSLGRFLHQYGRALQAEGRPKDAAVMFMRCALLYDASPFAGPSLLEAARIHRKTFGDVEAAKRLAQRALHWAKRYGDRASEDRARGLLESLEGEGE